jgi:hypothetical protein
MALNKCISGIKATNPDMTDADALDILESAKDLEDYIASGKSLFGGEMSDDAALEMELNDRVAFDKWAQAVAKRNFAININLKFKYDQFRSNYKNGYEALKTFLGGKLGSGQGGHRSVDAQIQTAIDTTLGRFIRALDEKKLNEFFASGKIDSDIGAELWAVNTDRNAPSPTGNKEARAIALIMSDIQAEFIEKLNAAGAMIRPLPGYMVRQSHDMYKIAAVTPEEYINFLRPLLNEHDTFGALDEAGIKHFMEEAYYNNATGNHNKVAGDSMSDFIAVLHGFKGPSNLGKKVSQGRVFHFKDANSWAIYNAKFGAGNLREAFIQGLRHSARSLALMETMGTNPRSMFEFWKTQAQNEMKANPKQYLKTNWKALDNLMDQLDGSSEITSNYVAAGWSAGVRGLQNLLKLGFAGISSVGDIPIAAHTMANNGVNVLQAYGDMVTGLFKGVGEGERNKIAKLIGVGLKAQLGDVLGRFASGDPVPGIVSKMNQKFFKLNGVNYVTDANQASVATMLAANLGFNKDLPFDSLPEQLRRQFSRYDITPYEWEVMRKAAWHSAEEMDTWFITPDGARDLDDAAIGKLYNLSKIDPNEAGAKELAREYKIARDTLASKFAVYLRDQVNMSVVESGAVERAWMYQGTDPGSALGIAMRMVMQFKTFPVTMTRRGLGEFLTARGDFDNVREAMALGSGGTLALASYIAQMTVMGYVIDGMSDLLKGKKIKDPTKLSTWEAAFLRSGSMGIYTDFLFGEFNRYGHSPLATLAGPVVGQAEDVLKIYSDIMDGKFKPASKRAIRFLSNNITVGANLPYTRMAFDYLILHRLNEMVNPGYLRRMERRMNKDVGQEYYLRPSSVIPYGG